MTTQRRYADTSWVIPSRIVSLAGRSRGVLASLGIRQINSLHIFVSEYDSRIFDTPSRSLDVNTSYVAIYSNAREIGLDTAGVYTHRGLLFRPSVVYFSCREPSFIRRGIGVCVSKWTGCGATVVTENDGYRHSIDTV